MIVSRRKGGVKNYWQITIELPRVNGHRVRKTFKFRGSKKEADVELQRLRKAYSDSGFLKPNEMTLATYLRKWLESVRSDGSDHTLRQLTWEGYRHKIEKHIIPEMGHILLSELKPYHISDYKEKKLTNGGRLDKKEGGLSPNTVNKHLVVLNMALEEASPEKQLIPVNPMRLVKRAGKKGSKVSRASENFLLADELKKLLHLFQLYDIYPIVFLAAHTGMRLSELLGLRWRDIDFKAKELTVSQSAHHGENGHHCSC